MFLLTKQKLLSCYFLSPCMCVCVCVCVYFQFLYMSHGCNNRVCCSDDIITCAHLLSNSITEDIHTNTFIAQALNSGGVKADYLPPLVTLIGYLMAFAAGSVS